MLFMSCVCRAFAPVHCCLWSPEERGLDTWLLFVAFIVNCYFPIWYPGTGVVLDCIDS